MITIKEIAKLAKVSEGTVDRVIHKRGGVSLKTEAKIRKILEEHDFSLNPIASALASKKNYTIACLIPGDNGQTAFWKSPYLGILKAEEEVKSYGVRVKNFFFDQFDPQSYLDSFKDVLRENPDVVIFAPIFKAQTRLISRELESSTIPYMFINIDSDDFNNISFIGQDSQIAGYVAGKLMGLNLKGGSVCGIAQTRENITDHNAISKRIIGFENYIKAHGVALKTVFLKIDLVNKALDEERIKTFFLEYPNAKGIYVPSSRASYIASLLPKDRSCTIVGFDTTEDNISQLKKDNIQFLISQRSFNQGYEAVKLMFEFLVRKRKPERKIYSPIQIIIKENVDFDSRYKKSFAKTLTTFD